MHALTISHRILSTSIPEIHAKRLDSLLAAVEAVVTGSRLTLSDMGRGLRGSVTVKHNIKRIDRLLGNSTLHTELPKLYAHQHTIRLPDSVPDGVSLRVLLLSQAPLSKPSEQNLKALFASIAEGMTEADLASP